MADQWSMQETIQNSSQQSNKISRTQSSKSTSSRITSSFQDDTKFSQYSVVNYGSNSQSISNFAHIVYSPIVPICQSTGTGKSKIMYEFSNYNFTSVICLRDENKPGIPIRSPNAQFFLDSLQNSESAKIFLESYLSSQLDLILSIKEKNQVNHQTIFRSMQPWYTQHEKYEFEVKYFRLFMIEYLN